MPVTLRLPATQRSSRPPIIRAGTESHLSLQRDESLRWTAATTCASPHHSTLSSSCSHIVLRLPLRSALPRHVRRGLLALRCRCDASSPLSAHSEMDSLLSPAQMESLLHILASSRPFHLISDAFHSTFDRTLRFRAALAAFALLQEGEQLDALYRRQQEEKKEDEDGDKPLLPASLTSTSSSALSTSLSLPSSSLLQTLSAVLRPQQRLAAVFLLYDFGRPEVSADGVMTAQQAQGMLLANPFLDNLLQHVDALESAAAGLLSPSAASSGPAASSLSPSTPVSRSLSSLAACERQLTIRLLLHQQLAAIRQRSAKDFMDAYKPDRLSSQSAALRANAPHQPASSPSSSELANLLLPLRAYVQARLPAPLPAALTPWLALCETVGGGLSGGGVLPLSAPSTPSSGRSGASISPASFTEEVRSSSPFPPAASSALPGSASPLTVDGLLELMQRAQKTHLSSAERQVVVEALSSSSSVSLCQQLLQHGFSPPQLPPIVEKNPALAVAFLQLVLSPPLASPVLSSLFLSPLLHSELSLHSMELVNRLSSASLLPPDFLPSYIHHALECCRRLSDRYAQTRMVRLVCVFLLSLLRVDSSSQQQRRTAAAGIDSLGVELQSFCVDFSKVKEATQLYRLLLHEQHSAS